MKVDKDLGTAITIALILIWLTAISFAIVDLYAYKTFMLEHICDIYGMIADVYQQLTNIFTSGVLL